MTAAKMPSKQDVDDSKRAMSLQRRDDMSICSVARDMGNVFLNILWKWKLCDTANGQTEFFSGENSPVRLFYDR
jgi:hypothetical protein